MRILMTGGSGVLGRVATPQLRTAGHTLQVPSRDDLDLLDPAQVATAVDQVEAVLHLATHIPTPDQRNVAGAWADNDRLRDDATGLLVDAALSTGASIIVVPTVAFLYPPGPADESTPLGDIPDFLRSALRAEAHLQRFAARGRRGIVLRLGSLYGPQAATPEPSERYGAHLHTADAAVAINVALTAPAGIYNVVDDDDPVSHDRFTQATGWLPSQGRQRGLQMEESK